MSSASGSIIDVLQGKLRAIMLYRVERPKIILSNWIHVISALDDYGLTLQLDNYAFFEEEVSYLGHVISKDGCLRASDERVETIIVRYAHPEDNLIVSSE